MKQTCLWLNNLPYLFHAKETDLFNETVTHVDKGERFDGLIGKQVKRKCNPNGTLKHFLTKILIHRQREAKHFLE